MPDRELTEPEATDIWIAVLNARTGNVSPADLPAFADTLKSIRLKLFPTFVPTET